MATESSRGPASLAQLPIGTTVQVECEAEQWKYMTYLVGVNRNKTVITALPGEKQLSNGQRASEDMFYEHRPLIMRLLGPGTAYAFKTKIVGGPLADAGLLVSSYPDKIQHRSLRSETRYPCTLTAELLLAGMTCRGMISNISSHGVQYRLIDTELNQSVLNAKAEKTPVQLNIHFPLVEAEERADALIKSAAEQDDGRLVLGMSFNGEPPAVKLFIDSIHLDAISPSMN